MTQPDQWEKRMASLEVYQDQLQTDTNHIRDYLVKCARGETNPINPMAPDTHELLTIINKALLRQQSFNQTVISLLTDLDHRKAE